MSTCDVAYDSSGKCIIEDAVPDDFANLIYDMYQSTDFDEIYQERTGYYSRSGLSELPGSPSASERYSARFARSRFLETKTEIIDAYQSYLKPKIEIVSNQRITHADLRCYRMKMGGHFRLHTDEYAGSVGFIWYLSKNWRWDWGGILMTRGSNGDYDAIIPTWNSLLVMSHQRGSLPHFVTSVEAWAEEPRLTLVGFLR